MRIGIGSSAYLRARGVGRVGVGFLSGFVRLHAMCKTKPNWRGLSSNGCGATSYFVCFESFVVQPALRKCKTKPPSDVPFDPKCPILADLRLWVTDEAEMVGGCGASAHGGQWDELGCANLRENERFCTMCAAS